MANNPYVNKVVYDGNTLIDISDTTATPENVKSGEVFYDASGTRSVGTANYVEPYVAGDSLRLGNNNSAYYVTCSGHITSGKNTLKFSIPLSKPINANGFSLSKCYITVRRPTGGYMYDADFIADTSGITYRAEITPAGITISIYANSTNLWGNEVNNICLDVCIQDLILTFN